MKIKNKSARVITLQGVNYKKVIIPTKTEDIEESKLGKGGMKYVNALVKDGSLEVIQEAPKAPKAPKDPKAPKEEEVKEDQKEEE